MLNDILVAWREERENVHVFLVRFCSLKENRKSSAALKRGTIPLSLLTAELAL